MHMHEPVYNAEKGTWDVVTDEDNGDTTVAHFHEPDAEARAMNYYMGRDGGCC